MYANQSNDLRDILETLQELNQAIEQQARVRVQLEAENVALARRLSEALAAERRQRCRATSSRVFAKRAQAATQPVIAVQKELVSLKRELAMHKKSFQHERRTLEDKVCTLQGEIVRIKEEKEAALAVADFAKEDAALSKVANQVTSSTAVPNTDLPAPAGSSIPMTRASTPPPPPPTLKPRLTQLQPQGVGQGSLHPRNGTGMSNAMWTGSGQLVWNPPAVNLMPSVQKVQFKPRRPVRLQTPRYKAVAGFQTASQLMQTYRSEEEKNQACDSHVSQSDSTDHPEERLVGLPSDDDCVIIPEDEAEGRVGLHTMMVKTEDIQIKSPEKDFIKEERIQPHCVSPDSDTDTDRYQRSSKKPRKAKKRRMFSTPMHDDFIG